MALQKRDSFDFYGSIDDMSANYWDTVGVSSIAGLSTNTRFGVGQSLTGGTQNSICAGAALDSNQSTIFTVFAYVSVAGATSSAGCKVVLNDSGTAQCSLLFGNNGDIRVYRGNGTTLLTTFSSAYSPTTWTQFQIKFIVDGSAGEVHIRINGNVSDDFSVTGLDLTSTANNYANGIDFYLGLQGAVSLTGTMDDLAIYDDTGSGPWNDWVGDIRAVQIMPNADTAQKQFSVNPSSGTIGTTNDNTSVSAVAANTLSMWPYTALLGGSLDSSVTLKLNASATGHVKVAIYDSDGASGVPGTLLAESSAITNPASGVNTFTLTSNPTVVNGRTYYLAVLSDVNVTPRGSTVGGTVVPHTQGVTYSSGFPSTAGTSAIAAANRPTLGGTVTPTNNGCVQEESHDGSSSYVSDDTVGDYDLYTVAGLTVTPSAILGVSFRAFAAKSDAGAREGAITIKSGTTALDSTAEALSTTFSNLVMVQDTDPDTGADWTATGINNVQIGPKVAS